MKLSEYLNSLKPNEIVHIYFSNETCFYGKVKKAVKLVRKNKIDNRIILNKKVEFIPLKFKTELQRLSTVYI